MEFGLSLGSNLGDRLNNIKLAKDKTAEIPHVEIVAGSAVYETEPVDVSPEFESLSFLNTVLILDCGLGPGELSARLLAIETEMGRQRTSNRNEPRLIDIDIIYAGQARINDAELTIPHPRWPERKFVVRPLTDVRPQMMLPGENRTVQQVLLSLPATPKVVIYTKDW